MKLSRLAAAAFVTLGATTSSAFAHPGHHVPQSGLISGLLHPLHGWDHLLAMVAVGLLSAQIGGRALWALPAIFVGSMLVGGVIGLSAWEIPTINYGIALSVILLGIAIALNRPYRLAVLLFLVPLFGFVHGHPHGAEMPLVSSPALYAVGFVTATVMLHAAGVFLGLFALNSTHGAVGLRWSGGAITAAGFWLALSP